jgi:hypothetical protein
MFRVFSAPIIRSTIKTVDAFIGTIHMSVWFKSVERCPRSGVYFTMSWPAKLWTTTLVFCYKFTLKVRCIEEENNMCQLKALKVSKKTVYKQKYPSFFSVILCQ